MGQWKNINSIIENRLYLGKYVNLPLSSYRNSSESNFSHLFIYSILAARSTRSLTERRITHILSVCTDAIPAELPESGVTHKRIAVEDVDYADLLIHLPEACRFIDHALRTGGVILVHCGQGLSRSAAVVVAYSTSHLEGLLPHLTYLFGSHVVTTSERASSHGICPVW